MPPFPRAASVANEEATIPMNLQAQPQQKAPPADQRSPRFVYWCCFLLCSLIEMGSSVEATDRVHFTNRAVQNQKWAVWCSTCSFIIALAVVMLHISPAGSLLVIGTPKEGIIILIMACLWTALVAAITDAGSGLAVDERGIVVYGNLYYFGWVGFAVVMLMAVSYLKVRFGFDILDQMDQRAKRLDLWVAFMIISVCFMSSGANVYDNSCAVKNDSIGTQFCNRTIFATFLGCIGATCAIIICGMKIAAGRASLRLEAVLAMFLLGCNSFSVALVTGEQGPGAAIGNLYYFSWFSVVLTFLLNATSVEAYHQKEPDRQAGSDSLDNQSLGETRDMRTFGNASAYAGTEAKRFAADDGTHATKMPADDRTYASRTYADDETAYGNDDMTYASQTYASQTYADDDQTYASKMSYGTNYR